MEENYRDSKEISYILITQIADHGVHNKEITCVYCIYNNNVMDCICQVILPYVLIFNLSASVNQLLLQQNMI